MTNTQHFHHDQQALYERLKQFMLELPKGQGIEVMDSEVMEAWEYARLATDYHYYVSGHPDDK